MVGSNKSIEEITDLLSKTTDTVKTSKKPKVENKKEITTEAPLNIDTLNPGLKPNEVMINGKKTMLNATQLRYFKNGYFGGYKFIEDYGLVTLFQYPDGEEIVKNFLYAVFNDTAFVDEIFESLDVATLADIITKIKKLNGIKDEDFLAKTLKEMGQQE